MSRGDDGPECLGLDPPVRRGEILPCEELCDLCLDEHDASIHACELCGRTASVLNGGRCDRCSPAEQAPL